MMRRPALLDHRPQRLLGSGEEAVEVVAQPIITAGDRQEPGIAKVERVGS
jgi:hypothetical protein